MQDANKLSPGNVVIYKSENFIGETEYHGVVESVDGDMVDLGIDGRVPIEDIVGLKH